MHQDTKIAIIEDNEAVAGMYVFKLENAGFEVQHAADGQTGLDMLHTFQPALVLLDLRMPVMNGDEILQKLRAEDWGAEMRVIILTNISKDEAPKSLRLLGVDRYIVKAHHTPQQVVDIVHEVLGLR